MERLQAAFLLFWQGFDYWLPFWFWLILNIFSCFFLFIWYLRIKKTDKVLAKEKLKENLWELLSVSLLFPTLFSCMYHYYKEKLPFIVETLGIIAMLRAYEKFTKNLSYMFNIHHYNVLIDELLLKIRHLLTKKEK